MRPSAPDRSSNSSSTLASNRTIVGRAVSLLSTGTGAVPAVNHPGRPISRSVDAPQRPGDAPLAHDRTPPEQAHAGMMLTPATPSPADLRRFAPDAARVLAERLMSLLGGARFDRYFDGGRAIEVVDDTLTVRVPSTMPRTCWSATTALCSSAKHASSPATLMPAFVTWSPASCITLVPA
jgi:hypothetical protein